MLGCVKPVLSHVGPMLRTCWACIGPMLRHVGPCWAYVGPMLGVGWAMLRPSLPTEPILGPFNKRGKTEDSRTIKAAAAAPHPCTQKTRRHFRRGRIFFQFVCHKFVWMCYGGRLKSKLGGR